MLSFNLTLIVQLVGFLLFAWLFNQVFFSPVVHHLEARDRHLAEQQATAERLSAEARGVREAHGRHLREAQASAQALVDAAVKEAQSRRSERLGKARAEASETVSRARVHLERERADLLLELRAESEAIALLIADRMLSTRAGERSREGAQA